jgi:multidrug resistance efflux pump
LDIPRPKTRNNSRYVYAALAALALGGVTLGLSRLKQAPPTAERAMLWLGEVKHGSMLREVKGPGRLVPEEVRWVTADTAGRVERIELRPGAKVEGGTPLMLLANPDVMLQALESERQLASAEAQLMDTRLASQTQVIAQRAALSQLKTELAEARRRDEANQRMLKQGQVPDFEAQQSADRLLDVQERLRLVEEQIALLEQNEKERMATQRAQLEKLRAVVRFRQQQVQSLQVRAGSPGILQAMPLELGQWVTPGTVLAKVAQSGQLKAELRIPEVQAKDVQPGQPVRIDTRNGVIRAEVSRIAPASNQGAVVVEARLLGELPKGARPDLNVDGVIEIERLDGVLHMGRPIGVPQDSTVELFKLSETGDTAVRVKVRIGRGSVDTVEVKEGLREGDQVVLSDMSAFANAEIVRLK